VLVQAGAALVIFDEFATSLLSHLFGRLASLSERGEASHCVLILGYKEDDGALAWRGSINDLDLRVETTPLQVFLRSLLLSLADVRGEVGGSRDTPEAPQFTSSNQIQAREIALP